MGIITRRGNFPSPLALTITAGRVFLISAPIAGSKFINHISLLFIDTLSIKLSKSSQLLILFVICEKGLGSY